MGTLAESSVPKFLRKYYKFEHRNYARDKFPSNFKRPKFDAIRDFPLNCGASAGVKCLLKMYHQQNNGAESASPATVDQGRDVPAIPAMLSTLRSMPSTNVKWDSEYSPPAHGKDDVDAQIFAWDDEVGELNEFIAQASKSFSSSDVMPSSCIDVKSTGGTDPLVQSPRQEGTVRDMDEVEELDEFIAQASKSLSLSDVMPSSCLHVKSTGGTDPLVQSPRQEGTVRDIDEVGELDEFITQASKYLSLPNVEPSSCQFLRQEGIVRDIDEVGELDAFIAQASKYLSMSDVKPSSCMDVKSTGRTDPLVQTPRQDGTVRDRDEVGELDASIAQACKYLSSSNVKPSSCIDVKSISEADSLVQTPRQDGTVRVKAVVAGSLDETGAPKVARERTTNLESIPEDNAEVDLLLASDCRILQPSMKRKFEDFMVSVEKVEITNKEVERK